MDGSSGTVTVDRRDGLRAETKVHVWMLRGGFLVLSGMIAFSLLNGADIHFIQLIMMLLATSVAGVGGEFIYCKERKSAVKVDLKRDGAFFHDPTYYGGLIKGKGYSIPRTSIERVDLNRDRAATKNAMAGEGGVPDSMVLVTKDGRMHGIVYRDTIQISRAAAFVSSEWGIRPVIEGREELDPTNVYGEFQNSYHSRDYLMTAAAAVFLGGLTGWSATWALKGGIILTIGILVIIIMLPVLILAVYATFTIYKRDNTLMSVIVRPQGFVLVFRDRRRELLWTDVTCLAVMQSQNAYKTAQQRAFVRIGKKETYSLSREPALALKKGYALSTNRPAPSLADMPMDRSGFTQNNMLIIKNERPDLHRSNQRVSGGLLANAIYMFAVAFLGSPLLILVGVFVMIALVSVKMKVTREMKLYIERRRGEMSVQTPFR